METTMTIMMSVNQVKESPLNVTTKANLAEKNRPDDRSLPQLA